jgi:hypothetical protein
MGLIHSRASKKRDKAEAGLLKAQRKLVEAQTEARTGRDARPSAPDPDKPILLQPTVGAAISEWRRRRNTQPPA